MKLPRASFNALAALASGALIHVTARAVTALQPIVEVEEEVYQYTPANNGAGPMWCHGSTTLVRSGDRVFATGLETIPNEPPLNNCRWVVFERGSDGWSKRYTDMEGKTREPSPLVTIGGGRILVSANPTLSKAPTPNGGPARPEIWEFAAGTTSSVAPSRWLPKWDGTPKFTEHSYRTFSADANAGEFILFQNIDYTHAEWTFRDRNGTWAAKGQLKWPWGTDYEKPQPIRVCYPNVVLRNRAVYFLGVSDIQEPKSAWREYKHQLTGQHWDYDFRRLFFTWSSDITRQPFSNWVEIASREKTCGMVSACDLWLDDRGTVHVLWTERALDERLREKFYPGEKQSHGLYYGTLREGKLVGRWIVSEMREGRPGISGSAGRFQITPENRLFISYYASGQDENGMGVNENRVVEVIGEGKFGETARVPLKFPFGSYFTATTRGGSPLSRTLEYFGPRVGSSGSLSYARVKLY